MVDDVLLSVVIVSLVALAVVVSGLLAGYSWSRIDHPVSDSYSLLMTADCLWAGGYLVMILASGPLIEVGLVVKATFSTLAGVAWLLFVSEYTGDSEWIPGWVWPVLTVEAVAFGVLVAINPGNLVIAEIAVGQFGIGTFAVESAGVLTEIQLLLSGGLVVVSLVFLGRFMLQTSSVYRYQALIIFLTGLVVMVSSTLFVQGFRIHPLVDPTPILFNGQAIAVGWALYRYDFLQLAPVIITRFFRDMNDPVVIINDEFVVAEYNRAADRLVEGLGERVPLTEIDDETFTTTMRSALSATEGDVEFTAARDDGIERTYDLEVTEVTDQFDITQGHIVVMREITERKRRERRLRKQNERLEEFADVISHDLRNPLSTAMGWTELTREELAGSDPDRTRAREGLEHVEQSHERMEELIDLLLTMARQGQTVDETEPVSITSCAESAWKTAETDGLDLVVETDRTVDADFSRLRQALENLFRNANDHGGASTVFVTDTAAGFAIEDDGNGIPATDRDSLFEFGYTTDDDGTGIGLAVVKRIIEAHGWQVTVATREGGGAKFEIKTG